MPGARFPAFPARNVSGALLLVILLTMSACMPLPGMKPAPRTAHPLPIADVPINLQGRCTRAEEDGFRENAYLRVRDSQVQAFGWDMQIGRRGSCRFRQAEFRQVQARPHIELLARDGSGCRLLIWRDARRVTMAHADCASRCTPGVVDEAWPVMFDPAIGGCARLQH